MERLNFTMLEKNIVCSSSIAIGHLVFFGATPCLMDFKCKEWPDGLEVHPNYMDGNLINIIFMHFFATVEF